MDCFFFQSENILTHNYHGITVLSDGKFLRNHGIPMPKFGELHPYNTWDNCAIRRKVSPCRKLEYSPMENYHGILMPKFTIFPLEIVKRKISSCRKLGHSPPKHSIYDVLQTENLHGLDEKSSPAFYAGKYSYSARGIFPRGNFQYS